MPETSHSPPPPVLVAYQDLRAVRIMMIFPSRIKRKHNERSPAGLNVSCGDCAWPRHAGDQSCDHSLDGELQGEPFSTRFFTIVVVVIGAILVPPGGRQIGTIMSADDQKPAA